MGVTERVSGIESTILIPDVGGITCLTRTEAYWICTLKPTSYPGLNEEFSVFLFVCFYNYLGPLLGSLFL